MGLVEEWLEVEHIFRSATSREKNGDLRTGVDWDLVDQSILFGALCVGCSFLEKSGRKGFTEHIRVLFHIRNALVHQGGDPSKNRDKNALPRVQDYLKNNKHTALSTNLTGPFFSLSGSHVRLEHRILFAIRMCLL